VKAAGNWELNSAWSHIIGLVHNPATPKYLLLAAIDAVACIRPREAGAILLALAGSDDEEIAEAAEVAISIAEGSSGEIDDDEDTNDWINRAANVVSRGRPALAAVERSTGHPGGGWPEFRSGESRHLAAFRD
jgi:hypothetical protein